jgi:uncharacterized RDD family membrane protein YckC
MTERTTTDPGPPAVGLDGSGTIAPVDPAAFADNAQPVGAMIRLLAYAVDAVLLVVVIYVVALVLRAAIGPTLRITDSSGVPRVQIDRLHSLINSLAATFVAGVYFAGSWLRFGRTIGQRLIGARVVRVDGEGHLGPGPAAARWLLLGTPLGLIATIVGPSAASSVIPVALLATWSAVLYVSTARSRTRRGFHDRMTGSIVVRRSARRADPGRVSAPPESSHPQSVI